MGFLVAVQPGDLLCLNRTPKRRHFDVVLKKKKKNQLNRPVPLESAGSSGSPVGLPVRPVRPRFDPHPVQMNGPDRSGPVFKTLVIS